MPEIRFVSALESGARTLLIRNGEEGARWARSNCPAAVGEETGVLKGEKKPPATDF